MARRIAAEGVAAEREELARSWQGLIQAELGPQRGDGFRIGGLAQ